MANVFPPGSPNPFADQPNPYAAPLELTAYEPPVLDTAPFAGLWRQGNLLVMHKEAPLPNICLKSNLPATHRLQRNLYWHHPAIFLLIFLHILIYAVVAVVVRKKAKIHIPLTAEWFHRRRRRMLIAWSVVFLGVVIFGIGAVYVDQSPWAPFCLIVAVFLMLGAAIYGLASCRLVSPKKMTDTYIWLKGVHPEYLDRLDPWTWNL